MCLLSSVAVLFLLCAKLDLWPENLVLNVFFVKPTYVSVVFAVVTVAW